MNNVPPIIARALAPFTPPDNWPTQEMIEAGGRVIRRAVNVHAGSASSLGALPEPWAKTIFVAMVGAIPKPEPVATSLVIDCPACYGGWRDTPTGVVMCGQCGGTGRVATNGGEV